MTLKCDRQTNERTDGRTTLTLESLRDWKSDENVVSLLIVKFQENWTFWHTLNSKFVKLIRTSMLTNHYWSQNLGPEWLLLKSGPWSWITIIEVRTWVLNDHYWSQDLGPEWPLLKSGPASWITIIGVRTQVWNTILSSGPRSWNSLL